MPGADFRVPMAPLLDAFGVAGTVTRPSPDDVPIEATVIWLPPFTDELPFGGEDFTRREPRLVLALPRATVPTVPRGTVILAPEAINGPVLAWKADSLDRQDGDLTRVFVVRAPELDPDT